MSLGTRIIMCMLFMQCMLQARAQNAKPVIPKDSSAQTVVRQQFLAASEFFDAAINSVSALNSLVKKESYRNKISAFNNPASSDLGFNLEAQIQSALKPLLAKAKTVNPGKFSQVVNALLNNQATTSLTGAIGGSSVFNSIVGLVGNITISDKRLTRSDLDSFIFSAGKYFMQFEKLQVANASFNQNIRKLDLRLLELRWTSGNI